MPHDPILMARPNAGKMARLIAAIKALAEKAVRS